MLFKNSRDVEQFATLPIQTYSTSGSFTCHVISHCSSSLTRSVSRSVAKNYSSRRVNVCTAVLVTISWPVLSILTHTDYNAG